MFMLTFEALFKTWCVDISHNMKTLSVFVHKIISKSQFLVVHILVVIPPCGIRFAKLEHSVKRCMRL